MHQVSAASSARRATKKHFCRLLFGIFTRPFSSSRGDRVIEGYGYETYVKGTAFIRTLVQDIQGLPVPERGYLKILFYDLKQFASTAAYSLMRGPAYLPEAEIKAKKKGGFFPP